MKKLLGLMLMMLPMIAVAQNAVDGRWRIDLNKTQVDQKPMVYELKDGMFTCSTCDPKLNIKADGQYQKVTNNPYVDTERVTVVNANTIEREGKKDGKVRFRETLVISADGKAMTEKYVGNREGDQVITATGRFSREGLPEPGASAISGSWKLDKWESASDNALTFVYTSSGDGLNYKATTGESYSAKFDGKDYPFHGDPGTTSVVLKKIDDHRWEETYKRNGEVVGISRITVSDDGKSLNIVSEDTHRGTVDTWIAEKQDKSDRTMADK
jgi:hypothetical protein